MKTDQSPYSAYRFPHQIISYAAYHCFCLSFRDVEDLLAERGIIASYETIRRRCEKFGPRTSKKLEQLHDPTRCGNSGLSSGSDKIYVILEDQNVTAVRYPFDSYLNHTGSEHI